jgi:methyltransferase (TIGR00027 family)
MTQRPFSATALGIAQLRAVHQFLDGEPKILDDAVVLRLLGADAVEQLKADFAAADRPQRRGLRADVVWRARYAEDRLARAVHRGVRQCVILGSGFDTFAYRQPDWARGLRIYEIDRHATQQEKRRRLQAAGIPVPSNLQFLSVDFEQTSLSEALRAGPLDVSAPTFFSCLGVLVYLTRIAMDSIFAAVAAFPAGSEIVFSISTPENASSKLAKTLSARGETWLTHVEPQTFAGELRDLGFSPISILSLEDAERTYFQSRSDGLRPLGVERVGAAVVGES